MQIFYFHLPSGSILGEASDTTAHTANANFLFPFAEREYLGRSPGENCQERNIRIMQVRVFHCRARQALSGRRL